MLRLLQDQRFERLGGGQTLTTRVRVLAATNQNLEDLVAAGRFRHDLYYRLKGVTIRVPALRERREDIPELAHYFLDRFARELHADVRDFAPEVLAAFRDHPWPGNVRELQGVIKDAVVRTTGHTVLPEFLSAGLGATAVAPRPVVEPSAFDLVGTIESLLSAGEKDIHARVVAAVEKELIARALRHTHGHQAQASELLGINRTTLRHKLRELGIVLDRIVAERPGGHDG
jgi:two-component system nitrogen regulation response regulator GlnG